MEYLTYKGLSPAMVRLSSLFYFNAQSPLVILLPRRCRNNGGLGSSAFARHYLRNHFCFLFLQVLRCFSSLRSPPLKDTLAGGLPHSEIPESRVICTSSGLIAAYHVLRRLREPRHPPSALAYFLLPNYMSPGCNILSLLLLVIVMILLSNMSKIFSLSFRKAMWRITDSNR